VGGGEPAAGVDEGGSRLLPGARALAEPLCEGLPLDQLHERKMWSPKVPTSKTLRRWGAKAEPSPCAREQPSLSGARARALSVRRSFSAIRASTGVVGAVYDTAAPVPIISAIRVS